MYPTRPDEPDYTRLPDTSAPALNRYGKRIELVTAGDPLADQSLQINGDPAIGTHPNRYAQHGFYFNADNCIACHACEAACSEKNDLPAHIAFRSVGYVEGGTYPAYRRLNISMACNHCDDPVCLKGCPTRAYTKLAEYGAVLQDPDICFGCGYCTWVCPYNAPQLDPVAGHVSKCNMCVDRLEAGLKPACASACLAGALDFGVIETRPDHREQLETRIPGFPTPEITHPNIRFQQVASLPREMTRPDSMPLRYERDTPGAGGHHEPKVAATGAERRWSLAGLRTREDPLVVFTLISQAVVGAFIALLLGPRLGISALEPALHPVAYPAFLFGLIALETYALVLSTMHLGRPHRFYRAFYNLRYSPVSREVASLAVFYNLLGAYTLVVTLAPRLEWVPPPLAQVGAATLGWLGIASGLLALFFMHRIYRIPARPFWDHWQVLSAFYGNMLSLGALTVGLYFAAVLFYQGEAYAPVLRPLALPVLLGLALEAVGLVCHGRDLARQGGEGAASHHRQRTTFGKTWLTRNAGLTLSLALLAGVALWGPEGTAGLVAWGLTALLVLATAVVGRALFYALVIPTTMPGAFFWRNRGFEEHARDSGLARMPQVGVVADAH